MCKYGPSCEFSHERLDHTAIPAFIEENEELIDQVFRETGKTNLGQYYIQYKRSKELKAQEQQRESMREEVNNMMLPDEIK